MNKRLFLPLLTALLVLLCACAPKPGPTLPQADYPLEFSFSSGAGAWSSNLTLNADGTFTGFYHDSDMGDVGTKYPNGTAYTCTFSGQFVSSEKLDEYSYRLQQTPITLEKPAGQEWIEDGIRYFSAGPHGLEGGLTFVLYTPDTPTAGLDEEFLSWWPGRFAETPSATLGCYGLWNVEAGTGFFTFPDGLM